MVVGDYLQRGGHEGGAHAGGRDSTGTKCYAVFDFQHPTRKLRIVRVPTCIPNEFIAAKLNEKGVKVLSISYEINRIDGVMSNVRVATIDGKYGSYVPDVLPWVFGGLFGRALVFMQGRPPRCHRCRERTHKVAECTAPDPTPLR